MKYLFIGILFLFVASTHAQTFLNPQESLVVIGDQKVTTEADLNQIQETDPNYIVLKNNLKAYNNFETHLGGGLVVSESIMLAVIESKPFTNVTTEQYANNDFPDPEFLRLKNHLVSVLSN